VIARAAFTMTLPRRAAGQTQSSASTMEMHKIGAVTGSSQTKMAGQGAGATMKSSAQRMNVLKLVLASVIFAGCLYATAQSGPASPAASPWTLVWSDEFNGPNGSAVDASKWASETGGNGWGNNELEYYTSRPQNAYQQEGNLVIKVLQEKYTGADGVARNYTSARLKTLGRFAQSYGRFEARIKIPRGQGIWPAFWMLGDDIELAPGWPKCGEIDIMENIGKEPGLVHGTIHGPGYSGEHGIGAPYGFASGKPLADDFHIYAVEWELKAIRFYVDDHLYATRTPGDLPPGTKWVYDHPFFLLLNVAVGGGWPGSPDASSVFPQEMLVDYVRVYRRATSTAAAPGAR
jgi:beta-glucanase (GH16 family)